MLTNENLPLGFSMALMENPQAFTAFAHMSASKQQAVIDGTHSVASKQEMRTYVDSIVGQG